VSDERCRITVVGTRRQVDLAVPAGAPIAAYAGSLARLCAEEENEIMPAGWSLAAALGAPFAPERSLTELGVADGAVLYLRDLIAGEYDEPLVLDIAEQVAETSGRLLDRPWTARARASAAFGTGLGWLIVMMLVLLLRHGLAGAVIGAAAAGLGAALPLTAWIAGERRWALPAAARLGLALSAVPLFALAAWSIASVRFAGRMHHPHAVMTALGLEVAAALAGALAGAMLAAAAIASVTTYAVLAAAVAVTVAGAGLAALKADTVQCAAVASVLGIALLLVAPSLAGRIAALAFRHTTGGLARDAGPQPHDQVGPGGSNDAAGAADGNRSGRVEDAVRRGMVLLAVWGGGLALVLAPCLAVLATSHSPYAAGLAGCLGFALSLHAGSAKVSVEVVPVALAGAVGLFTLVAVGPSRLGWSGPATAGVGLLVGLGLLGFGLRRLLRPELPAATRPGWFGPAAVVLAAAGIPLVLALFGVFGHVVGMGRSL